MKKLKFGVITDVHIPAFEAIEKNLYNALSILKERNVDLLIIAGDLCDQSQPWAYEMAKTVFDSAWGDFRPQMLVVPGNHDLASRVRVWDGKAAKERLTRFWGKDSVNTHLVLNGFHFLGTSSFSDESEGKQDGGILDWLEEELKTACTGDGRPVFVVTHNPPARTLPGSYKKTEDAHLGEILKKYPQVVSISGHTHFSLADEKSILQRDFTMINAGGLYCVCPNEIPIPNREPLELKCRPADAYRKFPTMLYAEVSEHELRFERLYCNSGEKCGEDWIIPLPICKENFVYTDRRYEKAVPPHFSKGDFVKVFDMVNKDYAGDRRIQYAMVKIPTCDCRVVGFCYEIKNTVTGEILHGNTYSEIDDEVSVPKVFHIFMLEGLAAGNYEISVRAVETFGKLSDDSVTCTFTVA